MIAYIGQKASKAHFARRVEPACEASNTWMNLRGNFVCIFAAGALIACSPTERSNHAEVAASVTPKERAQIEAAARAEAEAAANAAEAAVAPAATSASADHEYASREGNAFYYLAEDGSLIGALDLGRLPADQDFSRQLKRGDRAVRLDGGRFAAVSPGSNVVRISRQLPGEQILRPVENVPLSGGAVAARALRDSLAGRLLFPSEAALNARREPEVTSELDHDGDADTAASDDVSNARPDDFNM